MKFISSLILFLLLIISPYAQAEDPSLPLMKKRGREMAKILLDYHAEVFEAEYSNYVFEKYIFGAHVSLKNVVTLKYNKCATSAGKDCKWIGKETLNMNDFRGQLKGHVNLLLSKHFQYNLKTPFTYSFSDRQTMLGDIGRSNPHDEDILFATNKSTKHVKKSSDGLRFIMIETVSHLSVNTFTRRPTEVIKKVEIKMDDSRKSSGSITYSRLGPGKGQTDIRLNISFTDNKTEAPLSGIVTGDYNVVATGLFCGCEQVLAEDKVLDTKSSNSEDEHTFNLPPMVKALTKGRLLEDRTDDKKVPIKDAILKLAPACEEGDKCMRTVEETTTDHEGKFEFKDVPKGVYKVVHLGKVIGEIVNCQFQESVVDAGDFKVKVPVCFWDVEVSGRSHGTEVSNGSNMPIPYDVKGKAVWKRLVIEADPEVECHDQLPQMIEGYSLLALPQAPTCVRGLANNDTLFINLMRKGNSLTSPFMLEFNHDSVINPGDTSLGPIMNCGLWPDPTSKCEEPMIMSKLKAGDEFSFKVVRTPMWGMQVNDNFTYKFKPSRPICDEFEEDCPPATDPCAL
ncbi:MAG: hypothetical protein KAG61_12270 [Bacteriovoracaceae bacterium]|nr:hypothetical protein [Bacteriovoracaceae bacterium]